MRKRHPNDVIDAFQADARASLSQWSVVTRSVADQPVSLRRVVSRDAFFRLAVRWELFRSDWHIAAATRDPGQLRSTMAAEVDKALSGRPGLAECRPYVHVSLPAHPSLEQTRRLLDPAGRNISLSASSSAGMSGSRRARLTWRFRGSTRCAVCRCQITRWWSWLSACGTSSLTDPAVL